jgi:hypothetical protein
MQREIGILSIARVKKKFGSFFIGRKTEGIFRN